MTAVQIVCTPAEGILSVSAETVAALDHLAQTLPPDTPWQADVAIGWSSHETVHLTATPGRTEKAAA